MLALTSAFFGFLRWREKETAETSFFVLNDGTRPNEGALFVGVGALICESAAGECGVCAVAWLSDEALLSGRWPSGRRQPPAPAGAAV